MKKTVSILVSFLLGAAAAFAETVQKEELYSSFNAISLHNSFEVTLHTGATYSVKTNIDSRVVDNCRVYLQGTTLIIELDEKSMPKELKASLRKKDTLPLVLQADIYIPANAGIRNIDMDGSSILSGDGRFNFPMDITFAIDGNASVKSFDAKATKVTVKTNKKSNIQANFDAPEVDLTSGNNSFICLNVNRANTVEMDAGGSSQMSMTGSASTVSIKSSGSSKLGLNATINKLVVVGKGNSNLDAHIATINDADIDLTSSECWVVPMKTLKLKLTSGAKVTFGGNPEIEINKIQNSSVIREADSKEAIKSLKK